MYIFKLNHALHRVRSVLLVSVIFSSSALAIRPMVTDDATLVDDCELETWWEYHKEAENAFWLVPSCRIANIEWTVGHGHTSSSKPDILELGARTELRTLTANSWGATIGIAHETERSGGYKGSSHLNLAVSHSFMDDFILLHKNIGYMNPRGDSNELTLAIAAELEWQPNHWIIAETFREEAGRPYYQIGYRFEPLPDTLQLDASYGNRFYNKSDDQWLSIGMIWYFSLIN